MAALVERPPLPLQLPAFMERECKTPVQVRPRSLSFHNVNPMASSSPVTLYGGSRSPVDTERRSPPLDADTPSERRRSGVNASRYKTELCRPFMENGNCKYGEKCQFAHGTHEVRAMARHPKYKTEPCRTFHSEGFCPYGPRCHFVHDASERRERCTPSTPRSFSMSSPMTPAFPSPGRSPSPPTNRAADEETFPLRRVVHKPVQRQFSSPAAMGRAAPVVPPTPSSAVTENDDVFRRSPPASPQQLKQVSTSNAKFTMTCLQDAIDSVVITPPRPATTKAGFTQVKASPNFSSAYSNRLDSQNGGRRLPVFNAMTLF